MAQRRGPTHGLLLQDVILELMMANEKITVIESDVKTFNDSISKLSVTEDKSIDLLRSIDGRQEWVYDLMGKMYQTFGDNDASSLKLLKSIEDQQGWMFDLVNRMYHNSVDGDMIRAEQQRDLLKAIEGIQGRGRTDEARFDADTPGEDNGIGFLGAILGLLGASSMMKIAKSILAPIWKVVGVIGEVLAKVFRPVIAFIKEMPLIKSLVKVFDVFKFVGKLAKILGKAAIVITVIMSVVEGLIGAFKGYQKDGIMGAIKGGLRGLLNGLVGWILDLPKDLISWILDQYGMKNASKWLDSWNFESLFDDVWDLIGTMWNTTVEWMKKSIAGMGNMFNKFSADLDDFNRSILRAVLPDPKMHTSMMDPLYYVAKAIPDSVYDWAKIDKGNTANANIQTNPGTNGGALMGSGGGTITVIAPTYQTINSKPVTITSQQNGKQSPTLRISNQTGGSYYNP